jgi:hypothetical protein
MKRWQEDYRITVREWKKHWREHVENNQRRSVGYGLMDRRPFSDPFAVDCRCDEQKGRFRKKDAWDCGKARCLMCHSDKAPQRIPTEQEMRAEVSFREQLREYWASLARRQR